MPKSKITPGSDQAVPRTGASFRKRYDDLERQREALIARLKRLNDAGFAHPGSKRARKLLNETYRKSSLAQRIGILQAAAWLLEVIERLALTI